MTTQPEARITKKIREYLESAGAFVFKIHGSAAMMAGLPDLIACYKGCFLGVEVKQPGNKPTKRQIYVHSLIAAAGGVVITATSVDDVSSVIEGRPDPLKRLRWGP